MYTIGCDPEGFIFVNDSPVTAFGIIKGTKENPHKVHGGTTQVDGLAFEIGIDPVTTSAEFIRNILNVELAIEDQLAAAGLVNTEIVYDPTCEFGEAYMSSLPPEQLILGCEPDYSAYTGMPNPRPDGNVTFRTGAGHIHIGWGRGGKKGTKHNILCAEFVRELDWFIGVPSLLWDDDQQRRQLYGKAGAFRPKPYGLEYRTPSNAWMKTNTTMEAVFDLSQLACRSFFERERRLSIQYGSAADLINKGAGRLEVISYVEEILGQDIPASLQAIIASVRRMEARVG